MKSASQRWIKLKTPNAFWITINKLFFALHVLKTMHKNYINSSLKNYTKFNFLI